MDIKNLLLEVAPLAVFENEPIAKHTTMRVGGTADLFVMPKTLDELIAILKICKDEEYFLLGGGSNVIVKDGGYRGVVIHTKALNFMYAEGENIIAQAGTSMAALANFAMENSLSGLEFSQGIPGTLGGGIYMNCGAYGHEICEFIESIKVFNIKTQRTEFVDANALNFSYRKSDLQDNKNIVLSATLCLKKGDKQEIIKLAQQYSAQRAEKQPLNYPSSGSTFKRPEGSFASKLIDEAGLKGVQIGGAQVSEKHAGFIVNREGACAKDILDLIEHCRNVVLQKTGITLEPEVVIIGE